MCIYVGKHSTYSYANASQGLHTGEEIICAYVHQLLQNSPHAINNRSILLVSPTMHNYLLLLLSWFYWIHETILFILNNWFPDLA